MVITPHFLNCNIPCLKVKENDNAFITFLCFQVVSAERNMFETNAREYKNKIEQLTSELQDVKKKYFMQKRKEQTCR